MKRIYFLLQKFAALKNWFVKASLTKKIIFVLAILLIGWFSVSRILGQKAQSPQYQTALVEKGTLISSVTASGTVSSGSSVNITTSATGIVQQVYVSNGDTVSQGDKIAEIMLDSESQQRQAAAWSSYLTAKNSLSAAQAKMNSLQSALFKTNQAFMIDRGVLNPITDDPKYIQEKADWLQAEADYKNQAGVIVQVEASVNSTWLAYQQISPTITAPIGGIITNLTLFQGLSISGNQSQSSSNTTTASSQTLGTITLEGGTLQATINFSEIDIPKIKVGNKATLTLDALPKKSFTGNVSAINTNGVVSSGVTNYPVTITLDTAENSIYPNMSVTATIITNVKDNVLLVPSSAIQPQNNQTMVRVLKNGQVDQVEVTIGDASDTQTEITSGLNEGDEVITGTISTQTTTQQGRSPFSGGFGGAGALRSGGAGGARR